MVFQKNTMPLMSQSLESASKLRQMRLRSLTLHDPALLNLSIAELRTLATQARQYADDCGAMDLAYPHFAGQTKVYDTVAFLKECEERRFSREIEVALARFVPALGSDLFNLTSERALELAEKTEELAKNPKALFSEVARLHAKVNSYVELASVLEGWERRACPIAA